MPTDTRNTRSEKEVGQSFRNERIGAEVDVRDREHNCTITNMYEHIKLHISDIIITQLLDAFIT